MNEKAFVFVVCGTKEHIDTLHFSLTRLSLFTRHKIIVLTDSLRNEIPIHHDLIVDIKTPEEYNHHQASIFLKTGIYKFLPKGNLYCYLDTDVVALNENVDAVFAAYHAPISFAPDHCSLRKFSPYSVYCGCKEKWENQRNLFVEVNTLYDNNPKSLNGELQEKRRLLQSSFDKLKIDFIQKLWVGIRYFTSFKTFYLNDDFYFDKRKRIWFESEANHPILYEVDVKKIEKETGFRYNKWTQKWLDKNGNDIWQDECSHLREFIKETFDINVVEDNWQHWNGGVFLFDDKSHSFLDAWHQKTLRIFDLPQWRTRDQGTLIATTWEFGLQKHPTLSKQWNFIADYNKAGLDFKENGSFTDDFWKTQYTPSFIHIYHHWADENWKIWNWVASK